MGIFDQQQVIKFEQNHCNADINDNSVLFVRVSDVVKTKKALLEVPFSHNALLIKGGGDCRFYKSGTYSIFDDRAEVKAWKKGVSVEVVYIPKETSVQIRWGTPSKATYRDPVAGKVISIGARGVFGINISNPEQFFRKVVGARREFDLTDFTTRFSAAVVAEYTDVFLSVVTANDISYDLFDANKKSIGDKVGVALGEKFAKDWGINLVDFIIVDFSISAEDVEKVESVIEENRSESKLKEHLLELERLDDKQWEREKYLLNLKMTDREAYYEVLKVTGSKGAEEAKGSSFCPKCGHSVESNQAFCTSCGNPVGKTEKVCSCGKTNPADAAFCSGCGAKL